MRALLVPFCCLALWPAAGAQNTGVIAGTVTGPTGAALPNAPIQATNTATALDYRARSAATGGYTLDQLPPGTYEISVTMPGFSFQPYSRAGVAVTAGSTTSLDIHVAEGGNQSTLGDDPEVDLVRLRDAAGSGAVPRSADGHPDLSGIWFGQHDLYPEKPDALPWAAALAQQHLEDNFKDGPSVRCLPDDITSQGPFLRKFVQTPTLLIMLNESDVISHREVFLDGRGHPADQDPSWNGHSIGLWQGDTLVVDRTGFNASSWLGPYPHTEMLHIVERYRRADFGHLDVQVTLEDPGTFRRPWNVHMTWDLAPAQELYEYVCTENNRLEHLVGK